ARAPAGAPRRDVGVGARARAALRMAARDRGDRERLRGRDRGAGACERRQARRGQGRRGAGLRAACARAAAGVARGGQPARAAERSRALIVARRVGRVRERLPVVIGTLVSQTLMNILALIVLGSVMFATIGLFRGHERALFFFSLAPFTVLGLVLLMPALL